VKPPRYPLDDLRSIPEDLVLVVKSRVWARTMFSGEGQLIAPVVVEVQAHQSRDKPFFGDIVAQGPGFEQHGVRNPMVGTTGDILITNTNMISYRVNERGDVMYLIRNSAVMALLDPERYVITPAQHYILVKENEPRALALSSRGQIWIPTTDMQTDDEEERFNVGIHAEYGEVVAVGPGRWHEGQLQKPSCAPGDMLLYDCSHSTLAVTLRGERFTLVACTQEAMVYRDGSVL
jgi:co-chaperonin GroES (HSP10)